MPTLDSRINIGVCFLIFEKERKKLKNDHNALIDVKMNQNSGMKIFKRGATFIPGGTSIPESRVRMLLVK